MRSELGHMARAGKTFFFASLWLPRSIRADAATAYTFCRAVDDLADESRHPETAHAELERIYNEIESGGATCAITHGALRLVRKYPEVRQPLLDLVRACSLDGPGIAIASCEELVQYARGVAGTVGLVMYPMLGGSDPAGRVRAEALGVAMQCTNICRDVFDDLRGKRVYLPREWLGNVEMHRLLESDPETEQKVVDAVRRVLAFAEAQYSFALEGLQCLDRRCCRAIEIAARTYAEIGAGVIVDGKLVRGRSVVPLWRKIQIAARLYGGIGRIAEPAPIFSKST